MDLFNKISISHFIWYLMPGLGGLLLIYFPILVFNPVAIKISIEAMGSVGLILLCIILGFLLDGLRLYRYKYNYECIKQDFFKKMQNIVGKELDPYLIQNNIIELMRKKKISAINVHHSIWIMHGHFSILCFIQAIFWLFVIVYIQDAKQESYSIFGSYTFTKYSTITFCTFAILTFVLIGYRFMCISNEDQTTTNNMFLDFGRQHTKELKQLLNINH